ncbi:hypothetical protein BS50DRAFT_219584 [Corynespora cassiicola Philippines]|uniref:F-box domain-containing protein n=1 Tax=Corynespora cassiicola Philippines TaxID=1448308 RepID=A0A2T2N3I5_CORCC|nr:hypothetical protein BS50DRAFT_219584 [Corynespora cassiicola Philippines]
MPLDFLQGCFGWRPMEVPAGNERTTCIGLSILKAIQLIPTAVTVFKAREIQLVIDQLDLSNGLHKQADVRLALLLAWTTAASLLCWLFPGVVLVWKRRGCWLLLWGLIDFGILVALGIAISMQRNFLPASLDQCKNGKATKWQVTDNDSSLFTKYAETVKGGASAEKACTLAVNIFGLEFAVFLFQIVVAYFGVFFDVRRYSLLNPNRPLIWFLYSIFLPFFYFWETLVPYIRFSYHYLVKFGQRMRRLPNVQVEGSAPYIPRPGCIEISNSRLQEVLQIEHLLLNIVHYSHYEDILHLSMTSRAVHEAIFPSQDLKHRVPKLLDRVCDSKTRHRCEYCNMIVCYACKRMNFYTTLPGRRHVTQCKPYCGKCYFDGFSRHSNGHSRHCSCCSQDKNLEFQDMCTTCAGKSMDKLQAERHKRFQLQARQIAYGKSKKAGISDLFFGHRQLAEGETKDGQCAKCKEDLKPGMRWWICGSCQGECKDWIHPPHVGKIWRPDLDLEMGCKGRNEDEVKEVKTSWWLRLRSSITFH